MDAAAKIRMHRSLQERMKVARNYVAEFGYTSPFFADTMSNDFSRIYHASPEKLIIVGTDSRIQYINKEGGPYDFDIARAARWLSATFPEVE